tara:strand:- start:15913 stop:17646 length:1734 start_codon:yes stop_codon:yes gene_type:complete
VRSDGGVGDQSTNDKNTNTSCVPSQDAWNSHAKQLVEKWCGKCHGKSPDFGAPNVLINYDDLLKGVYPRREVDRIAARLLRKNMPPPGSPQPTHADLDTLVEWATCGTKHADHTIGLKVSAKVFTPPAKPPEGTDVQKFDLRADKFAVGEKVLDLYQCFAFKAPIDKDRFIQRIETVVDESRVLHHVVLLRVNDPNAKMEKSFQCRGTPGAVQYMYAWAPGGEAVQFPDGGVRIRPGEQFVVQIHYNNGAGVKNAVDSSGLRIYHGPPTGTEYGMLVPGPHTFSIAKGEEKTVSSSCTMSEKTRILANMPHMHEIGTEFSQKVSLKDGSEKSLIDLRGWSFEIQNFYHTPMTLEKGEKLVTTCTFKNTTDEKVTQGSGTKDEMCFAFMYVTPPPSGVGYCNELGDKLEYTPGKCAPDSAKNTFFPPAKGQFVQATPPALKGGTIPDSKWIIQSTTFYLNTNKYAGIELDLEKSQIISKGLLQTTGSLFELDTKNRLALRGAGSLSYDTDSELSARGKRKDGATPTQFSLEKECGDADKVDFHYEVSDKKLTIGIVFRSKSGLLQIIDRVDMTFTKVD